MGENAVTRVPSYGIAVFMWCMGSAARIGTPFLIHFLRQLSTALFSQI